jgi:hypothetical protein
MILIMKKKIWNWNMITHIRTSLVLAAVGMIPAITYGSDITGREDDVKQHDGAQARFWEQCEKAQTEARASVSLEQKKGENVDASNKNRLAIQIVPCFPQAVPWGYRPPESPPAQRMIKTWGEALHERKKLESRLRQP